MFIDFFFLVGGGMIYVNLAAGGRDVGKSLKKLLYLVVCFSF